MVGGGSDGGGQPDATKPFVLVERYQMLERIGEGGMGVVWRCFDLDLEEPVAIKFLREDYATDERLRASFRREVKLARRVTHPNVARVFEFGKWGDLHFLTMEYVVGQSLQALLTRSGALPPAQVAALAFGLCRGLAAAHAAGVVHGDIKPGNVLVAPDRGAVLTDFGIARALSEVLSREETIGGTPLYMPPEQQLNEAMTPQNDVYAVGVLLFEALTGQVPWPTRDTALLLAQKLAATPDLRRLAPGLPSGWAALIADCLHPEPERRPADGRALLARLAAIREVRPSEAIATASAYPPPPPLATSEGPRWIEVVPLEPQDGPGEPGAAWATSDLIAALTQVRGLRVVAGRPARAVASPQVVQIRGSLRESTDGVIVTAVLGERGAAPQAVFVHHQPRTVLHNLGADLAARVVAALTPGAVTALPRHEELTPDAAALYVQARTAFLAMRPDTAVQLYEAALATAPNHRTLRLGHTMARVQSAFFSFRPVGQAEIEELRAAVEAMVRDHGALGEAHLAHASIALALCDPVTAASAVRTALERAPGLVGAHIVVADLLLDIGRLPDAERHLDIALTLEADNRIGWTNRARLRAYQGRWGEFYALVAGKLAALKHRSTHLARLMLWRPDTGALAQLAAVYADNADGLPPPLCQMGRDVVAFAVGQEDRAAVFARLMRHPGFAHPRYNRRLAQVRCELACQLGELDQARTLLAAIAGGTLADWSWIEHCPLIEPLRGDRLFAEIRTDVRGHADVVADALWG